MRLFLDANVLIDFMGERPAFYMQAATLFSFAADKKCEIVVSSLSMVTSYFICCDRGRMDSFVWKNKVMLLKEIIKICSVDSDDIYSSCRYEWNDFEDCVQYCVAKKSACDIIVTRNARDFAMSDMPVMTPDDAIDMIG